MSTETAPRFAGDMRWVTRWQDGDGNVYGERPWWVEGLEKVRALQIGVPRTAGPSEWFTWEDVPEVDET